MVRIRFHGRGGHGTKTASRIVGTAAFLGGFHAQDSPVYGAERRGAAVVAFTRMDRHPILERGVIESPDLIVLADETLLESPDAQVLANEHTASAIFVNCEDASSIKEKYGIQSTVLNLDLTSVTLEMLGSAGALSSGLAAAAARLTGLIGEQQLIEAIKEELSHLRLSKDLIGKNVDVARAVFSRLDQVEICPGDGPPSADLAQVAYDDPVIAAPSILNPGNAVARQTGAWRVERPVIDPDVCTRCGLCFVRCPEGVIELDADGFPVIDYDHCKGCMICHQICPLNAVTSIKETQAW